MATSKQSRYISLSQGAQTLSLFDARFLLLKKKKKGKSLATIGGHLINMHPRRYTEWEKKWWGFSHHRKLGNGRKNEISGRLTHQLLLDRAQAWAEPFRTLFLCFPCGQRREGQKRNNRLCDVTLRHQACSLLFRNILSTLRLSILSWTISGREKRRKKQSSLIWCAWANLTTTRMGGGSSSEKSSKLNASTSGTPKKAALTPREQIERLLKNKGTEG